MQAHSSVDSSSKFARLLAHFFRDKHPFYSLVMIVLIAFMGCELIGEQKSIEPVVFFSAIFVFAISLYGLVEDVYQFLEQDKNSQQR